MKTTERVSPDDTIKTLFRTLSQQKTKMYALYIPTSAASKNTMHPSVETKYVCWQIWMHWSAVYFSKRILSWLPFPHGPYTV